MADVVVVTNRNGSIYKDGCAGIQYAFPPGEDVLIPTDAARHIFGYGLENRMPNMVRMGIANKPNGQAWLEGFEIRVGRPRESVQVDDPAQADLVQVINHNETPLTDGFDGRFWTFYKGQPTDIPLAAARHIFGYGMKGQEMATLRRFGWRDRGAMQRLKNFRMIPVRSQYGADSQAA